MLSEAEIGARLARYARSQDRRDLWPEVPAAALRAAQEEVARVAALALAAEASAVELRSPRGVDVHALGVAAFSGGMGALLGFWIETGRVGAVPAVAELFGLHLDHGRRRAARLGEECERILAALAARGVEPLLLKGTHTARAYFPDPGTRPTADVDLLVTPQQRPSAEGALRRLGFLEDATASLPERTHWTPPGARSIRSLELSHADDPWSVDLHVSLDRELLPGIAMRFGAVEPSSGPVWHGFSLPVRILPQPDLLAFLAAHLGGHFFAMPLVRLVELIFVARRDFRARPDLWPRFGDVVERHAVGRFVLPAIALAERLAPGTMDARALERVEAAAPRRLRRRVHSLTPASAQRLRGSPLRDRWLWGASRRETLGLLLDTLWPRDGGNSPSRVLVRQWRRVRRFVARIARRGPA